MFSVPFLPVTKIFSYEDVKDLLYSLSNMPLLAIPYMTCSPNVYEKQAVLGTLFTNPTEPKGPWWKTLVTCFSSLPVPTPLPPLW